MRVIKITIKISGPFVGDDFIFIVVVVDIHYTFSHFPHLTNYRCDYIIPRGIPMLKLSMIFF